MGIWDNSPDPHGRYDGRYNDGRTAISHPVKVSIAGNDLVTSGSGPQLRWPLKDLEVAEFIHRKSKDVMIHEPGRNGGTLYVADPVFVQLLAAKAPKVTSRARRWMGAGTFLWITGIVGTIALVWYVTDFSLPRAVAELMPKSVRVKLGKEVVNSMSRGRRTCTQADGKAALDQLAKRLSEAAGKKGTFTVSVVDSEVVNAFAAPGEQIVILRKLIDTASGPDEVAGVLAHEMGHGIEMHPETGIVRAVGLMAMTEIILGGSGGSLANLGLYLTQLGYTRQAERQADAHAISILKAAGVSPQGIIAFFRRVGAKSGEDLKDTSGSFGDVLRTHPSIAERLSVFEALPAYPVTPALTPVEWKALRSICQETAVGPSPAPPTANKPKPPAPPRRNAPSSADGRDI